MKKKRKLNLGKSKIASINSLYNIKGGMTVGCNTNGCPSDLTVETCLTNEGATTCPKTLTTRPDTDTCGMDGSGTGTTNGGGATNNNCSANLPSLNC